MARRGGENESDTRQQRYLHDRRDGHTDEYDDDDDDDVKDDDGDGEKEEYDTRISVFNVVPFVTSIFTQKISSIGNYVLGPNPPLCC